ncbi:adenosine-specific kinase, partial [candidate division WOR-3 bacterium]|nr:adenosine-specific kinase [candidate division WOR-3 bacterium]
MEIKIAEIEKPEDVNFILGQSHFIKTVEDIHEVLIGSVPGIKFGIGFCEASGLKLVRFSGNDDELIKLAKNNALRIGAGHSFIIFIRNAFPINLLPRIKAVPEVCRIFCATANPTQVIIG